MYKPIMSHDIDFITKYKSPRNLIGAIRRSPFLFSSIISEYRQSRKDKSKDPYWTLEEMLDINNSYGIETHFYFKTAITNPEFDWNTYKVSDPEIKELILNLKSKGAIIGLHPSYESYLDSDQIKREKELLEEAAEVEIIFSRQHFLRYNDPLTFQYLAEAGIKLDSSIGYTDKVGIKGSSSMPYIIYEKGKNILLEQPFLMMETHLLSDPDKLLIDLKKELIKIKKEEGVAMVIWHNNNYETKIQRGIYNEVLQLINAYT